MKAIDWLIFISLVVVVPVLLASSPGNFNDGDVSWHLATGQWILAHHAIPLTDPFSFTAAGHRWAAMEWFGEVQFALAFKLAGYAGLAAMIAASVAVLNGLIFLHIRQPIVAAITILALEAVLTTFILARPHVLVWPILAGWTILLQRQKPPPLYWALLMTVWANTHGSFILGFVVLGALAFDALNAASWERRAVAKWALFGFASVIATLISPNGLERLIYPFQVMGSETLPFINEWRPSSPSWTPLFYVTLLLLLATLLRSRVKVPLGRLALILVTLGMAFAQVRHQSWFVIIAAAVIPPLLVKPAKGISDFRLLLPVALVAFGIRAILPLNPPEGTANPSGLIAAIPASLRSQPVFNGYTFGGPLILAGIRPYIDGRADMYGDAFFLNYAKIVGGDFTAFQAAADRYDVRWTMLSWGDQNLIDALDESGRWKRIYSDKVGVIHVRTDAAPVPQR